MKLKRKWHLLLGSGVSIASLCAATSCLLLGFKYARLNQASKTVGTVVAVQNLTKVVFDYRLGSSLMSNSAFVSSELASFLSAGSNVTVFYLADDPSFSTIEGSRNAVNYYTIGTVALLCSLLFVGLVAWGTWRSRLPPSTGYSFRLVALFTLFVFAVVALNAYLFVTRRAELEYLEKASRSDQVILGSVIGHGREKKSLRFSYRFADSVFTSEQVVASPILENAQIGSQLQLRVAQEIPNDPFVVGNTNLFKYVRGKASMNVAYALIACAVGFVFYLGYVVQRK